MIIVGAKGFAKEVLEVLFQKDEIGNIAFFDNVSSDLTGTLYDRFPVLKSNEEVSAFFKKNDRKFTLGIGGPVSRYKLFQLFQSLGGEFSSVISPYARIGHFNNSIGYGCNVMTGTVITNDVKIGKGVLINLNCTIGHDSVIGDFVEMSPGVHVSGRCSIGDFCNLGTNCTILPGVSLGDNVIVGAGAVVTKDVESNTLVTGVPAQEKRKLDPIGF